MKNDGGNNLLEVLEVKKELENAQFSLSLLNKNIQKVIIVTYSTFQLEGKIFIILIMRNITNILDKQIKKISKKYESIILFSTSHEIRSQLNLIRGNLEQYVHNYSSNFKNISKMDIKLIKISIYSAKIMEYKLNLLIDFVNILSGKFVENEKACSLNNLEEEIAEIINAYSCAKNLNFSHNPSFPFNKLFSCDYVRFTSIVIHVALNSVKFTYSGSVSVDIIYENNLLIAKIIDTGIGIDKEFEEKINNFSIHSRMII